MNMNEIKTPALDKLLEVQDQMDLCRNFLEYFLKNYSAFEKKRPRESVFADVSGAGDYINVDKLFADFFEIDLPQAEKEREALLDSLKEHYNAQKNISPHTRGEKIMKYTILMSCGHQVTVDLVGKNSERERKIKYFETQGLCKECYKKEMQELKASKPFVLNASVLPHISEKKANRNKWLKTNIPNNNFYDVLRLKTVEECHANLPSKMILARYF